MELDPPGFSRWILNLITSVLRRNRNFVEEKTQGEEELAMDRGRKWHKAATGSSESLQKLEEARRFLSRAPRVSVALQMT